MGAASTTIPTFLTHEIGLFMLSARPSLLLPTILLALASVISGCGQKGRLYLEGQEPASQRAVIKKKRAAQAQQAEAQLKSAQEGHDDSDDGKDNAPELAPSAPN